MSPNLTMEDPKAFLKTLLNEQLFLLVDEMKKTEIANDSILRHVVNAMFVDKSPSQFLMHVIALYPIVVDVLVDRLKMADKAIEEVGVPYSEFGTDELEELRERVFEGFGKRIDALDEDQCVEYLKQNGYHDNVRLMPLQAMKDMLKSLEWAFISTASKETLISIYGENITNPDFDKLYDIISKAVYNIGERKNLINKTNLVKLVSSWHDFDYGTLLLFINSDLEKGTIDLYNITRDMSTGIPTVIQVAKTNTRANANLPYLPSWLYEPASDEEVSEVRAYFAKTDTLKFK